MSWSVNILFLASQDHERWAITNEDWEGVCSKMSDSKLRSLSALKIDLLKNHPEVIPQLSSIWHEVLGKIWMPEIGIEEIESLYYEELNLDLPLTYIALDGNVCVGSCTLQLNDDVRPDLGPWIESLVVDPAYQKQGIGKMLLDVTVAKANELGFEKVYLFAFDPTIPAYYQRFGWETIGINEYKSHRVTVMEIWL
jgi:N-acetylglutamate synthase-like GNAT family acetyltransferase